VRPLGLALSCITIS